MIIIKFSLSIDSGFEKQYHLINIPSVFSKVSSVQQSASFFKKQGNSLEKDKNISLESYQL